MRPTITNKCKKKYRINVENITKKITGRIPEKYLEGLEDISLLDIGKAEYPMCRYIPGIGDSKHGKIEIYLDNRDLTKIPFFSTFAINIHLLLAINQHIDTCLKPQTEEEEILSINTGKIEYSWMYFGVWEPLLIILKTFRYLFTDRRPFKRLLKWWANRLETS